MKLSDKDPAANKESDLREKKSVSPGSLTSYLSARGAEGLSLLASPALGHAGYKQSGQRTEAACRVTWGVL